MADGPRIVWITGAGTGIGRALALEHARRGDTVLATGRTRERLDELRSSMPSKGSACEISVCDVRDEGAVHRVVEGFLSRHGRIDILVNNAGVTYFRDFLDTSTEQFDHVVSTNLRGLFLTTHSVLPAMIRSGRGMIVNILSFAAKAVYTGSSVYAASKAGAEAMMNVLRAEVREKGIHIVNIYPGAVRTPIWHPKHQERYGQRMLAPEDVARTICEMTMQPESVMVEELILRPPMGDLQV